VDPVALIEFIAEFETLLELLATIEELPVKGSLSDGEFVGTIKIAGLTVAVP
jgi:hypothetical protein